MNRNYELVVIFDPELKGTEQEKLLEKVKNFITTAEGKVTLTKEWGKKELAYPIKKKKSGLFYVLNFQTVSDKLNSLRQKIQLEEKILRFLLITEEDKGGKNVVKVAK